MSRYSDDISRCFTGHYSCYGIPKQVHFVVNIPSLTTGDTYLAEWREMTLEIPLSPFRYMLLLWNRI